MSFGTKCKGCVFYKPNQKSTCSINKLEKFGDSVGVDEDGPFLKERFCPFHRSEKWANGKDNATLELFVHAENRIANEVFIYIPEVDDLTKNALYRTLESLSKIDLLKPKYVRVITSKKIKTFEYIDILGGYDFTWSLDEHKFEFSKEEALYASSLKSYGKYMTVVNVGYEFENDFFYKVENYVNCEMQQLIKLDFTFGFCMPKWIFQKEFIENKPIEKITKYEDLPD